MAASLILSASLALILAQQGVLRADQAASHIGETATVEGRVSIYKTPAGETYLDVGGSGPDAPFSAYVSRWNKVQFQDIDKLDGKTVQITGEISTFRDKPEIFLTDSSQITEKPQAEPARAAK